MNYYEKVFWLILSFAAICYIVFCLSRKRLYELAARIPGLPSHVPLIGNALQFYGNTLDITNTVNNIINYSRQNDGILKLWLGPLLYIAIMKPSDIEIILNKELNKAPAYRFLKPWMGNGLVCGDLATWKVHRKRLMPTFNQKILDTFIETFSEKSQIMGNQIVKAKGTFNVIDYVAPCNLDIICATAMGVEIDAQKNYDTPYIRATIAISKIMYQRMFQIWLQPDWIYKFTDYFKRQTEYLKSLHGFTRNVMLMKKQQLNKKNNVGGEEFIYENDEINLSKRKAFLDLLMDGDAEWTDQELQEEVDTMTTAGNDVTTHSMCFALLMLGSHQQVQDKLYEEIYDIFGDSDRPVVKEDLSRMSYMERVIKETIRLFPIAPIVVRQLEHELKLENYTLPAGAGCVVCIYGVHRDPSIWGENAEDFDPDNFLPEKCAKRHPYAYIPFSSGPRNCIGKQYAMMSMKVMLANILRKSKIFSTINHKTMETTYEILIKPVGGYPISVVPRN